MTFQGGRRTSYIMKGYEIEEEEIIDIEVKSMTREELEELAKQTMRETRGASA